MKKLVNTEEFINSRQGRRLFRLVQPLADRLLGFHGINKIYYQARAKEPTSSGEFCQGVLEVLDTEVKVDPAFIEVFNTEAPLIIVANHPYGCIDAMALIKVIDQHARSPWKVLANQLLRNIEELSENTISVFPSLDGKGGAKTANVKPLKEMQLCLKAGGILVMFPAGRVSGRHPEHGVVTDLPWSSHPLTLACKYNAKVVFSYLSGHNSESFLSIPSEKTTKRTIALAKEVDKNRGLSITLNHSLTMSPELASAVSKFTNKEEILRAFTYIGADKSEPKSAPKATENMSSYLTDSEENFYSLLEKTQDCILDQKEYCSYLFQGSAEPAVMDEIGKLRSKTFSLIGAGSGKEIDLASEDDYYHHIVLVEKASGKIAGSYRVGFSEEIRKERGEEALYLNGVFQIEKSFYDKIGESLELSRSFIPPEFQRSPKVLDLLWKSLGQVATQSGVKTLYGSVTISADYTPLSKAILVDTLDRHHSAAPSLRSLIKNTNPFKPTTMYHPLISDAYAPHGMNRLNPVITELENGQRVIPPLMRYYTSLGAKFLSFKVEPTFGNAIYCLLTVDLESLPPQYKKRFLKTRS